MYPNEKIKAFLNSEVNLKIMTLFARGMSPDVIAEKVGTSVSFVEGVRNFLRNNDMVPFGAWNIDVSALGMIRTLKFSEYNENGWKRLFKSNFYLSYLSRIEMGKEKFLAMYTFPEEVREKMGAEISSWYYLFPQLKKPFISVNFTEKEFCKKYEEKDNENPLPPRGEVMHPDLVDIYICRYIQREALTYNREEFVKRIKNDIGDMVKVSHEGISTRIETLKRKNIIYPVMPYDFTEAGFISTYCMTSVVNVFRLMKALSEFNIITGISFMKEKEVILFVEFPYKFKDAITSILNRFNRENEIYLVKETYKNRGIPYKYYLDKFRKECGG